MAGADDEAFFVRLRTFDGQESKWHVWKTKVIAYLCYKNFHGILNDDEVSQGDKDCKGARVE